MTFEEYYGDAYGRLVETKRILDAIADELKNEDEQICDIKPVVYSCSRIKKPSSMVAKLELRGFPKTREAALTDVYDAVGLRIICAFNDDINAIVKKLFEDERISVIEYKDYLSHPKPNGYRSFHLCIKVLPTETLAEIQVRTIAMDFWATLEHQIKYKRDIENDKLIRSELKRCADEIASVDLSMQTIREILKEMK